MATTPGRPPLADDVSTLKIRLPTHLLDRITALSIKDGVTRSEWVRRACTHAALSGLYTDFPDVPHGETRPDGRIQNLNTAIGYPGS